MTRVQQKGPVDKTAPHLHKHPATHYLARYEHLPFRMTLKTIAFSLNDVIRENNVRNTRETMRDRPINACRNIIPIDRKRRKRKKWKKTLTHRNQRAKNQVRHKLINKILIKTPQLSKGSDILQLNEYKRLSRPSVARKQATLNVAECSFHQLRRALQGS